MTLMTARFLNFIYSDIVLKKDDKVLLAVSGGIDSMVMLHLFFKAGIKSGIAHCNFCLRGEESDKDEELVRNIASVYGMPFYSKRFNSLEYAESRGYSVQMAARELRYSWFEEIRRNYGYDYIATGHNLNDNIETILINFIRGTGIAGLAGIKPVNGKIIRPVLFADREEITKYCLANNIPFREDKTNAETKYIRNKLRHKVIPLLHEINPSVVATLSENAGRISDAYELIRHLVNELKTEMVRESADKILIDISKLQKWSCNSVFLHELFRTLGITDVPLKELRSVINGKTGSMVLTSEKRIIKNRNELLICPFSPAKDELYFIKNQSDFTSVPFIEKAEIMELSDELKFSPDKSIAYLDLDKLKFPLIIRKWKKGDFFYPFGMNHRKKLSDFFTDSKMSLIDKERIYVMLSDMDIAWVIGARTDNRFRITESTSRILILKASKLILP